MWPLFQSESVVAVPFGQADYTLGDIGFQMALSSGQMTDMMSGVAKALREYNPVSLENLEPAASTYQVQKGLPGTNELPIFRYLGVYVTKISFEPGSVKLSLSFSVMFHAAVSAVQGYPDLREGIEMISADVSAAAAFVRQNLQAQVEIGLVPEPRIHGMPRGATLENHAFDALVDGTENGPGK